MKNFKESVLDYYKHYGRDLPWRHNRTPYTVMLSEFLLDRTTVKQALPYYISFLESYPTLKDLAHASEQDVLKKWAGLGFYSRAKHLLASAIKIDLNGNFPSDFVSWRVLPGVGDYMAASISSILHQDHYVAFDGNIKRVLSRIYERDTQTKETQVFINHDLALTNDESGDFNEALMDIGSTICLKNPLCATCPLKDYCLAFKHQTIEFYPVKTPPLKKQEESFISILFKEGDNVILRERSEALLFHFLEARNYPHNRSLEDILNNLHLNYYNIIEKGSAKQVFSHKTWYFIGYVVETSFKDVTLKEGEAIYKLADLDLNLVSAGQKFLFK